MGPSAVAGTPSRIFIKTQPLCAGYGLSEASPVVALNPHVCMRKKGSVGLPLREIEVRIVDETGRDLPAGETGELLISGPGVMKGYAGLPEETATMLKDGWLPDAARGEVPLAFLVPKKGMGITETAL